MIYRKQTLKKAAGGASTATPAVKTSGTPLDIELMTPGEAAQFLKVSPRTLARWRMTGEGPAFTPLSPQAVRYVRADLIKWLEGRVSMNTQQSADILRA